MSLPESYSDVILRHYKNPEFKTIPDNPTHSETGRNTLCGDEVHLYIVFSPKESAIENIGFTAKGCMICQASASILCHAVKGKKIAEASEIIEKVKQIFDKESSVEAGEINQQNEYLALMDVRKYPGRKKCALLAWKTLERLFSALK